MDRTTIPTEIQDALRSHFGQGLSFHSMAPLSGGSINAAHRLVTSAGSFFLKYNNADRYPDMFVAEAKGLQLLRAASSLKIPEVLLQGAAGSYNFLLMEYLVPGRPSMDFFHKFGQSLALMHKTTAPEFGLDHHNYIGSLQQDNTGMPHFHDFFITRRLEPMVRIARDTGKLEINHQRKFEAFYNAFSDLIPTEKPAFLHGDLWNGNFLIDESSHVALIDPAVYFGHRETELAMTKLFGGFDPAFYAAYQEEYPLEKGWEKRLDLHNLYPLMVHVNLFGGDYLRSVIEILKPY